MKRDVAQLHRHLLQPERNHLGAARMATAGIIDPRQAWSALAVGNTIPATWDDSADRAFFAVPCPECPLDANGDLGHYGCPSCKASAFQFSYPRNVAACLTIASDPEGILRAEGIAKEARRRLRAWGATIGPDLVWQVESEPSARQSFKRPPMHVMQASAARWWACHEALWQRDHALLDRLFDQAGDIGVDVKVCVLGEEVYDALASDRRAPYVDRPNPYTPLLDIVEGGYVPRRYDERGFALVATRVAPS